MIGADRWFVGAARGPLPLVALAIAGACAGPSPTEPVWQPYDPAAYVDPLLGTGGLGAQTTGVGPHAAVPFGMTLTGPDTRSASGGVPSFYHYGGYHHDDATIDGFTHSHGHGMGIVDFGAVSILPRSTGWDPAYTAVQGRTVGFDHGTERASPGVYAVDLADGTHVAIAATEHGAAHTWTFAPAATPCLVLDLGFALPGVEIGDDAVADVAVDPGAGLAEITGFQRVSGGYSRRFDGLRTSFVARLDPPPTAVGAWSDPAAPAPDATHAAGATSGLWATWPAGTETVRVRVALSYVDLDGARANFDAELADPDADYAGLARAAWQPRLDVAHVWFTGDEDRQRTMFHTAQYRTMLMPRTYRDVDGRYRGIDGEVHALGADEAYLSDLSLWDTYRTVHPWYALVAPDAQRDVARSLVRMVEDGGTLPRWPLGHGYTGGMVGSPATIVLAETALKGIDGWDAPVAFDAAFAQATGPTDPDGRGGIDDWTGLGFVTSDNGGAASLNLEYAWADTAGAAWARSLGREADADVLARQGGQWRNTWDPDAGFFRARARDGSFAPFDADRVFDWSDDYVEGDAWHYLWMVPYDVEGMIAAQHAGDPDPHAAFEDRLAAYWDEVYAEPDDAAPDDWYWHGNEPVMHYAWLGALAGRPDLTAEPARWIVDHRYDTGPEGLDGNDDAGTLSAWLVWSMLGVYPVAGTTAYALGSPVVAHAELGLPGGALTIDAPGASAIRKYPRAVSLDGEPLDRTVDHAAIASGGALTFELADAP